MRSPVQGAVFKEDQDAALGDAWTEVDFDDGWAVTDRTTSEGGSMHTERHRQVGTTAKTNFTHLIAAGVELGDVRTDFSPEILAAMVVGTLNMLTTSWAMDSSFPVFAKLEEARAMFEKVICREDGA